MKKVKQKPKQKPKQKGIDIFLEISTYLTGFNKNELLGTGMLETYYQTVDNNSDPKILKFFYAEAARILSHKDKNKILSLIKINLIPDSCYHRLAKNIITMWYLSTWGPNVISPESYKQGLVWDAAETHPPGAKQPGFGTWAEPPLQVP